jgi:hypothetical protein
MVSPDQLWATFSPSQKEALVHVAVEFLKESLVPKRAHNADAQPTHSATKSTVKKEPETAVTSKSTPKSEIHVKKTIEKAPLKSIKTEYSPKPAAPAPQKPEKQVSSIVLGSLHTRRDT